MVDNIELEVGQQWVDNYGYTWKLNERAESIYGPYFTSECLNHTLSAAFYTDGATYPWSCDDQPRLVHLLPSTIYAREINRGRNMSAQEAKRQTGRTIRMLKEAITLGKQGRAVYVLFASHHEVEMYKRSELGSELISYGGKLETESSLVNFDFGEMKLRGAHPNCVVLVDHHVIERKFYKQFEAATRFDAVNDRLTFTSALRIARGCKDYNGGYQPPEWEIYQHGIQTVINALQSASMLGLHDPQIAALHGMGTIQE